MSQQYTHILPTQIPGYHPVTRWLHAGLVLGVLFQLFCAAQMVHPEHAEGAHGELVAHAEAAATEEAHHKSIHEKDAVGVWLMDAHRTGGFVVVWIVLANLLWAVIARGTPRKRQIGVLFSARHWFEAGVIVKHLPRMLIGKHDLPAPGNSLSLIVEMFGMLTMAAMALTGLVIWLLWGGSGATVSELAEMWMEIHAGFAVLLFVYLAGHVSMALLHWHSGDSVFSRVLPWGRGN